MHVPRSFVVAALLVGSLVLGGCTTYRDQLARGQHAFEQNEHDRTLAILRDLEPEVKRLTPPEQAAYAYLRGMTDYRVGYKPDARHWLAIAKAHEDASPGVLPVAWKSRANETLTELNGVVYTQGVTGLSTTRHPDEDVKDGNHGKKDGVSDTERSGAAQEKKEESPSAPTSAAPPEKK